MLLVPVQNDSVVTKSGHPFKVVSFSNLNSDGPLLRVISSGSRALEEVLFGDVDSINGQQVTLVKNADGFNVFHSNSAVKRPASLPQPGDKLTINSDVGTIDVKVKRLNLHVKNNLAAGLYLDVVDSQKVESVCRLSDIVKIDGELFNKSKFKQTYNDYFGTSNE